MTLDYPTYMDHKYNSPEEVRSFMRKQLNYYETVFELGTPEPGLSPTTKILAGGGLILVFLSFFQ